MSRKQHVLHVLISPPPLPDQIHNDKTSDQHWRYVQKYDHLDARFITVTYHVKACSLFAIDWFCIALSWFTNKRLTFLTALDIKRYQNHIAWQTRPTPLVSSKVLIYRNFRNQVRGVHICLFSCATLSSLYIPLCVLPVLEISAAP